MEGYKLDINKLQTILGYELDSEELQSIKSLEDAFAFEPIAMSEEIARMFACMDKEDIFKLIN